MSLYLVRHTAVDVATGVCYGRSDVPLAASFADEYIPLTQVLPPEVAVCMSSPLVRCRRLAETLYPTMDIRMDARLQELDFGAWELQPWDELDQATVRYWGDHYIETPCPGGESFQDLHHRTREFLDDLPYYDTKDIVVVTHGGVIRSLLAHVQKQPLSAAFDWHLPYGYVVKITPDGVVESMPRQPGQEPR